MGSACPLSCAGKGVVLEKEEMNASAFEAWWRGPAFQEQDWMAPQSGGEASGSGVKRREGAGEGGGSGDRKRRRAEGGAAAAGGGGAGGDNWGSWEDMGKEVEVNERGWWRKGWRQGIEGELPAVCGMDPGGAHKFVAAGGPAAEADLQDRDDTHWQRTQQPGSFCA